MTEAISSTAVESSAVVRRCVIAFCLALVAISASSAKVRAESVSPPNFLVVLADDCTYRDLGCYGGQAITPHIDQLSREGMRLTRCFQTAPMCSPTRHNLYTGQYPVKTGAYPNHTQTFDHIKNVTHFLKPAGYRLALSGKVHIGPRMLFPFEYSSDKNNPDMDSVESLLEECKKDATPFCLFACSNEPHSPWNKGDASLYPAEEVKLPEYLPDTPEMRDGFSRYLAEITYYDSQVGQLLGLLEKYELASNTVVIVLSEQGNSMPFAKWTCYDNGLQSAMLVRWPGHIEAGAVSDAMVEYVDVLPTLMDIAGVEDSQQVLDGKSFLGVLQGKESHHKSFVYGAMTTRGIINGNESYPIRSVRSETHKLILNLDHDQPFTNACVKSREFMSLVKAADMGNESAAKAVDRYQNRPEVELYDIIADPFEMNNLASYSENAEIIFELRAELQSWMEAQGDLGVATEMRANSHKKKGSKPRAVK